MCSSQITDGEPDAAAPSTTAVGSDVEVTSEGTSPPSSTTDRSRTVQLPPGSDVSEPVTVSGSTHEPVTTPTTETTPPDAPTDSPVPVCLPATGRG